MSNLQHIEIREPVLKHVGAIADAQHLDAYVVGGYVRDALIGKHVRDIDVMVLGNGIEFARLVQRALPGASVVVFERFGTAQLAWEDWKVEFVGARKESYERDSRKPAVSVGTLQEDLSRRDFTINAMAASLNKPHWAQLADPFNGRGDLAARILRTPLEPAVTFDDDPLRIMRAFRFAAQVGCTPTTELLSAAAAMRDRLSIVSQERISDELLKTLLCQRPSIGLKLMFDTGVMEIVFPEVAQLAGIDQRQDHHHKDVFLHTLMVLDNIAATTDDVWLRVAALLHDIAKPRTKAFKEGIGWTFHGHEEFGARMVKPIFRRLKWPLDRVKYVEKLVRLHLRPMALVDEGVTDSAVRRLLFDAGEEVDDLMKLCRADITSKNPKLVERVRQNYELVAEKMREVEEKDRIRNWQPPLRGDEIMKVCGLQAGPKVGVLKDAITNAILDGKIPNEHDAALAYLLRTKDTLLAEKESNRQQAHV